MDFSALSPTAAPVQSAPTTKAEPANKTILLVDDEETIRTITSRLLERSGFRVLTAATPGEAVSLFDRHRAAIDLLLTDVVMPEMHGPVLAQHLVGINPDLPVLFISGYNNVDPVELGGRPNSAFLSKPFSAKALITAVNDVLSRGR
jgi:two-component system cell cycle sensor histidine kinase/response regulator CckA